MIWRVLQIRFWSHKIKKPRTFWHRSILIFLQDYSNPTILSTSHPSCPVAPVCFIWLASTSDTFIHHLPQMCPNPIPSLITARFPSMAVGLAMMHLGFGGSALGVGSGKERATDEKQEDTSAGWKKESSNSFQGPLISSHTWQDHWQVIKSAKASQQSTGLHCIMSYLCIQYCIRSTSLRLSRQPLHNWIMQEFKLIFKQFNQLGHPMGIHLLQQAISN